jgi:hypothetical protein
VVSAKHPLPSRQDGFIRRLGSGEVFMIAQNMCEPVVRGQRGRVFLAKEPLLSGKDCVVGVLGGD